MILGGIEGIPDEGDAIGTGLEHRLPFLGREVDEKRHLLEDGLEGGLDGLHVGGREGCVDVLVGHGGLLWAGWFLCGCGAGKWNLAECVLSDTSSIREQITSIQAAFLDNPSSFACADSRIESRKKALADRISIPIRSPLSFNSAVISGLISTLPALASSDRERCMISSSWK